jgi:protein phosphatase
MIAEYTTPPALTLPNDALVLLVGPPGCGKSTFAREHFAPHEVISSDALRLLVANDEGDQRHNSEVFELLHTIVDHRMKQGHLTVVDATNLKYADRERTRHIALKYKRPIYYIVWDVPKSVRLERDASRERRVGAKVIDIMYERLEQTLRTLAKGEELIDGYALVDEYNELDVLRVSPLTRHIDDTGPFDVIGDVHGCFRELCQLLLKLGYKYEYNYVFKHPEGRKAVFVGDIVDRGPDSFDALELVKRMCDAGSAYLVMGNHDDKFMRYLQGRAVQVTNGLDKTIESFSRVNMSDNYRRELREFLERTPYHLILDGGRLVVAHAGLIEELHGQDTPRARSFALYGQTTGEKDDKGYPVRLDWTVNYQGRATVVYGHTPQGDVYENNNTYNIDTGCVFGRSLSALRYPELEVVSVPAHDDYDARG